MVQFLDSVRQLDTLPNISAALIVSQVTEIYDIFRVPSGKHLKAKQILWRRSIVQRVFLIKRRESIERLENENFNALYA